MAVRAKNAEIRTITGNLSGNATSATTATNDTKGQAITSYIRALSISGRTITYTKGDGTTGTITTQDTNTTYTLAGLVGSTAIGSTTQPIYWDGSKFTTIGYTIAKSVPSNAVFTDTNTTYSAGTGLSLSGTTFNHKNSVTAATAQGDASKTLTFGGTFTIPTVTYDAQGHITAKGTTTMTMPANPNTDTHYTTHLYAGTSSGVANASTTNGNTYLIVADNSTARNRVKITGSGATTVTSDANGVITISSTDTNTNTWRGVQDNLTSTATDQSLSANQGRVLKGLVDGKAAASHSHSYLPLAGGTMASDAQIIRAGYSTSWIGGRSRALIRLNTISGYSPAISIKTTNGSWDIGAYDNPSYADKLVFSYCTDANFNVDNNSTTAQIMFNSDGSISGKISWDSVTGKPSSFTPASHSHDYLPLAGGTMSGSIITPKNDNMGIIPDTNNYGQIGSSDKKFFRMYATTFYGNLSGTATNATQDSAGQQINTTYIKALSVSGTTITYTKGDGTTGTITTQDTNTWRGVQDNLTSTATDQSLSANQGKVLKGLVDGKADASHTHSYLPLSGGTMSGNLTMGDTKTIILRTHESYRAGIGYDTSGNECIALWAKNTVTRLRWYAGKDMSTVTAGTMMGITPDFEVSKASGSVVGYLAGNTIIHSGNYTSYTVKKDGTGASGSWGISVTGSSASCTGNAATATTAGKLNNAGQISSVEALDGFIEASRFKYATIGAISGLSGTYNNNDGIILSAAWTSNTYGHQIYLDDSGYSIHHRFRNNGAWSNWVQLIDSSNYKSYCTPANIGAAAASHTHSEYTKIYKWTAVIKCATWSRLCYIPYYESVTGSSYIIHIQATRGNVVYNDTFAITTHHSRRINITRICGASYSVIKIGVLSDANGNSYVELYDDAQGSTNTTTQNVKCTLISISTGTPTLYTSFTDGSTLPSGYNKSDMPTDSSYNVIGTFKGSFKGALDGNAATATKATQDSAGQQINTTYIKALSVSGRTITYTKGDGTTGTITTQDTDTNTHYTTHLYAGTSSGVANAATTNGNTYLILTDDSTARNRIKITGSGATTVTSDANGVITISSTDTNTNTTYSAGTGLSLSGTTFSNAGVRSISSGSTNGTISVNTNGTSAEVAVKGLGSAAYTASSAYASASHTHSGYVATSGGAMTGALKVNCSNVGTDYTTYRFRNIGFGTTSTPTSDSTYGRNGAIYFMYS